MANNSEIVPAKQKMANLRALLTSDKVAGQIMNALKGTVEDKKRMFRVYLTAMQTTPKILECEPISVIGAIMQAAQVGLSLDTVFGEAFLIPRWNKNAGATVCGFQIGYKGLCKLARTSDHGLRDIYARVVYQNDHFSYSYEPKRLEHTPCEDPDARGPLKYAYAKVIWKEDNYDRFVVVTQAEIKKAQAASDSFKKNFGPWLDNPDAMWAKTSLIRLCKTLNLNAESDLSKALAADDAEAGGKSVTGFDFDLSLPATTPGSSREEGGSVLDNLAGQPPQPAAPAPRQQRRRRAGEQQQGQQQEQQQDREHEEPSSPRASSQQQQRPFEERPVGSVDPRTNEVIE